MTQRQAKFYKLIFLKTKKAWEEHVKSEEPKEKVKDETGKEVSLTNFLNNILMQLRKVPPTIPHSSHFP